MGLIKDSYFGKEKKTGFSINSIEDKLLRKNKIDSFVIKYGRGDKGLSNIQKNNRIEKFLISQTNKNKVKGFGLDKTKGVDLQKDIHKINTDEELDGSFDEIENDIISNLTKYPKDQRACENKNVSIDDIRIVNIKVKDNGEMVVEHIFLDGNQTDPNKRIMSSLTMYNDYTSALNESEQFKKGILEEVSDRTMKILDDEGVLDLLLEDDSIDTNEDKILQF